jgi:hypothetical protein
MNGAASLLIVTLLLAVPEGESPELQPTLERLSRLAQLIEDSAMSFACDESIHYRSYMSGSDHHKFSYVYERNEEGEIEDYRTWAKGGRKKGVPREVNPEEFNVPAYIRSSYLWVFAFKEARWRHHRYSIVGHDTVLGREAVGIRFDPVQPYIAKINDWFGTAWVDLETTQLLRVEAMYVDDYLRQNTIDALLAGDLPRHSVLGATETSHHYTMQRVTTEFTFEKNGLRFPGRVVIERDRVKVREKNGLYSAKTTELLRVVQKYDNYQFFNVQTASQIRGFIDGR